MTETTAKRLERLKDINDTKYAVALGNPTDDGCHPEAINIEQDIDWLIEQAELRQIDHQASVLANKINTAFTKRIMDENKRLRETLEGNRRKLL